jgi:hypothetical protein
MYGLLPADERNIKQGAFPELGVTFCQLFDTRRFIRVSPTNW